MFQISEIYLLVFSSNFILYFSNVEALTVLILMSPLLTSRNKRTLYVLSFSLFFICSFHLHFLFILSLSIERERERERERENIIYIYI